MIDQQQEWAWEGVALRLADLPLTNRKPGTHIYEVAPQLREIEEHLPGWEVGWCEERRQCVLSPRVFQAEAEAVGERMRLAYQKALADVQ